MESSATASHDPHRPHHTEQLQRLSTEAMSPFSNSKAQNNAHADQLCHSESLLHKPDAPDLSVVAPADSEHHSTGNRRSATPTPGPAVSPSANGSVCTHGQDDLLHTQHLQQASQAEASASEAAPLNPQSRAAAPPSTPQAATTDKPIASMSMVSTSAQSAAKPTQTSSLPSGAYRISYPAATLSASPQSSPIHVPPMQAAPDLQQASSQQTIPNQRQPPPQQLPLQSQRKPQQPQQQMLQQQRYHMFLQAQALQQQQQQAQKQASFQNQQQQQPQQQAQMGKPPLQQPFGLQGQSGRHASLPALQPRVAQPVWPVPVPRATSGKSLWALQPLSHGPMPVACCCWLVCMCTLPQSTLRLIAPPGVVPIIV